MVHRLVLVGSLTLLASASVTRQPAAGPVQTPRPADQPVASAQPSGARAAAPTSSRSAFTLVGGIKDLMEGIIDPAADVVFDAVAIESTAAGVVEKAPKNDEEWAVVRNNALMLAESGNLLKIGARRVAGRWTPPPRDGAKAGPEELTPAQIEALIAKDRGTWNTLSQALTDAALVALKAASEKNVDGIFASGEAIDNACENCHLKYWYPNEKKP